MILNPGAWIEFRIYIKYIHHQEYLCFQFIDDGDDERHNVMH